MTDTEAFDQLVAEGAAAPMTGWDFSWLRGRASEGRPRWRYSRMLADRMAVVAAALDIQTGGGEVLSAVPKVPPLLAATEHWPPNLELARRNLEPLPARVYHVADDAELPFADESFDLVTCRHPVTTRWDEIARVLEPGGTYLSQCVGPGSLRELTEFLVGPRPLDDAKSPERTVAAAEAVGLNVVDVRRTTLHAVFNDIAAVVYLLRKVIWLIPDFSVERSRDRLGDLNRLIESEGAFVAHTHRFLLVARKP
jgi:SAM-dependent methyltransferase